MSIGSTIRNQLVDSPTSLAERFRLRRWENLSATYPDLAEMHVIDLGGTVSAWQRAPIRPRRVTVLTFEPEGEQVDGIEARYADACALPAELRDLRADLVYSNAVLEHVGGAERRQRFAETVHSLADRHWIQTPYRYFPIEPHWLFPGFQFLPVAARVAIGRRWKLVHTPTQDAASMTSSVLSVELVGVTELRHLFPQSEVRRERFVALTKSIIAVKT
ncbi:class I SAM-dependent methyltransferase [Nocardioides albus]|uniref:Class I SAM-dependent methyltransferase n=1 Tax=Nocardioides albus TaxID=1841 RepID=A0A7W5A022_9ACTN|nr:class I SAM-dependent methyltransferase [Nocardioides albus]MBB3087152.1 hypothetical protein [Nocardioides albus]GGU07004.1 hypothetical protein GCM10007979_00730 [Nocardioides albus]